MTSWKTRAPGARCCANGRRCIRNSAGCRASSRSPSQARPRTAPPPPSTTSACASCAGRRAANGFRVLVGGGMGRTPYVGQEIRPFLEKEHLLSYIESILRVYNLHGRRDNTQQGAHQDPGQPARHRQIPRGCRGRLGGDPQGRGRSAGRRNMPASSPISRRPTSCPVRSRTRALEQRRITDPAFANWLKHNVRPHRVPGYVERRHLAERAGPHAGRRQLGPDGFRCRSRRALQPQRGAGELHAEPHPAACRALRPARRL